MTAMKMSMILAALLFAVTPGCGGSSSPTSASSTVNVPYSQIDLTVGTGRQAAVGNHASVYYTGWLYSATATDNKGRQFDSLTSGAGYPVVVGVGQVIKGFDQGLVGLAVGGKRRIIIPPSLGYGATAAGSIPANSTLVFEIELVSLTD
jgi:FKBP-type peptidyl-prolyl cis-trans isomerase FkpA